MTKPVSLKGSVVFLPILLFAIFAACMLLQSIGAPTAFEGILAAAGKTELMRASVAKLIHMCIIVAVLFQTTVATDEEGVVRGKSAALCIVYFLSCAEMFFTAAFNPDIYMTS